MLSHTDYHFLKQTPICLLHIYNHIKNYQVSRKKQKKTLKKRVVWKIVMFLQGYMNSLTLQSSNATTFSCCSNVSSWNLKRKKKLKTNIFTKNYHYEPKHLHLCHNITCKPLPQYCRQGIHPNRSLQEII